MAAKVVWYREAWWVRVRHKGKKREHRCGPTRPDKRRAEQLAKQVNASITLGSYRTQPTEANALPCDSHLRSWLVTYAPTMKHTSEVLG